MVNDERRMRYPAGALFQRTPAPRCWHFSRIIPMPSTTRIRDCQRADRSQTANLACRVPQEFPVQEGKTAKPTLREALCYKGLHDRYGERAGTDSELIKRLDYELSDILERTGFVSYFLIVWDFIHFAKQKGIPVGPGRGSAAGSLVAYVLGITDIDPLQFGLIFERFLNPERVSPPDIDVDFCKDRRGEGAGIRSPEIRRTPGLSDRHVQQNECEKRGARCRPSDWSFLRRS